MVYECLDTKGNSGMYGRGAGIELQLWCSDHSLRILLTWLKVYINSRGMQWQEEGVRVSRNEAEG